MTKFFGKYRGKVENNVDSMLQLGRIQVSVPDALGEGRMSWAMPCVPYAGSGVGFFAIPPVGANVWVEFEGGNLDSPIWSGCFWGRGEVPAQPAETTTGMKMEITAQGIEITNGQGASIKLEGPKVSINGSALEVV